MPARLAPLPCPSGPGVLTEVLPRLRAALEGSGPALLPVPDGPTAQAVRSMGRLDEALETGPGGEPVALVVPTSGSTGQVKGALLGATAMRASARAALDRLGGPGRWLLALPTTHVAGLNVLVRSLLADTEPVPMPLDAGFTAAGFVTATARLGPGRRYTALVPTQLRRLLVDPAGAAALASYDAVLLGGAAAEPDLLERAQRAGVHVVTTYGMSETCGGCVYDGVALDGVQVVLEPAGTAHPGASRVVLGGSCIFLGYRGEPARSVRALRVDEEGTRWHLTNDTGRWEASGRLAVLGRLDDLVVSGGENVAPALVERALLACSLVAEAVVVGVPDPQWGQRVVAVVVPADPARPPGLGELVAACRASLPAPWAPRGMVLAERLPMLGSGKPDREAIRGLAAAQDGSPG